MKQSTKKFAKNHVWREHRFLNQAAVHWRPAKQPLLHWKIADTQMQVMAQILHGMDELNAKHP